MNPTQKTREQLKDEIEVLLRDYLRDNLGNWHVKSTPERIEEYLRFHMPGYTREALAKLFDAYKAQALTALLEATRKLRKDEHPTEDGVPVEVYGYEAEFNSALDQVTAIIEGMKGK